MSEHTPPESPVANLAEPQPATRFPFFGLVGIAVLLCAVVGIGIGPKLQARAARSEAAAAASQPRAVVWTPARRAPNQSQLVIPGAAVAIETAAVYARTTGFVRQYLADMGDTVTAGQILAVLDTPELESDAKGARAKAAEAELNAKLSHATAERYQRLAEAGADSRASADQFEAQANSAKAAIDTSRAEVSRTDTLLGFRFVRAPFAGVITRRNVEQGTLVTAGSSSGVSSLFEIARTETLKVLIDVPQALASSVHIGDEVVVEADKMRVLGRVARTSKALDPRTRTLRVEIHVPGDQGILAGSFVRARFDVKSTEPPVLVPANALSLRADGTFVFTLDDSNQVQLVKIEIGRDLGVDLEVASGLTGAERVVVNPPENLGAGESVRPLAPSAPPRAVGSPASSVETKH